MKSPRLEITVDGKKYYFQVEEFHNKPVPQNTVLVISRRARIPDQQFDIFHHLYIAVDEGYTSSEYMIHPLNVGMDFCVLTAVIEDIKERKRVVQHFRELATQSKELEIT